MILIIVCKKIEHPQTNGQVESANRVLLKGLKRRLEKAKGTWSEEVPQIFWAYHITPQSTTKEMPFSLVYGSDTMIPVEIQALVQKHKINAVVLNL